MYPSAEFRESYNSTRPELFTAALAGVVLVTGLFFAIFIVFVQRRQKTVLSSALRTNALVSAMFPSNVRDRIMAEAAKNSKPERGLSHFEGSKRKLKSFLADEPDIDKDDSVFQSKPIADLFPAVTISK